MISPCRTICRLDESGHICVGCGRTLAEIAAWASMTEAQRRQVMRRLDGGQPDPDQLQPTQ